MIVAHTMLPQAACTSNELMRAFEDDGGVEARNCPNSLLESNEFVLILTSLIEEHSGVRGRGMLRAQRGGRARFQSLMDDLAWADIFQRARGAQALNICKAPRTIKLP